EYLLIIHLDEETKSTLSIGCQQSERYKNRVSSPSGSLYLNVPGGYPLDSAGHYRLWLAGFA
ncbi:MAG: hypothetical protein ACREUP_08870, partial [Burkholderiales bacterium]